VAWTVSLVVDRASQYCVGVSATVRSASSPLVAPPWILVVGAWFTLALVGAIATYGFWQLGNQSFPFWRAIAAEVPRWFAYALHTPGVFWAAQRFPLVPPHVVRHLSVHVTLSIAAAAAYSGAAALGIHAFSPTRPPISAGQLFANNFLGGLPVTLPLYFGVLAVAMAMSYFARHRDAEVQSARLETQLADARLAALQMQLHPHFLFNSLNTITVFARDGDNATVVRLLELLGETLRATLRATPHHEVSLGDEIAFVRKYLEIEEARFSDRLRVRVDVAGDVANALVPAFVLQPLVENAIRHGIARRSDSGLIEIAARCTSGALELTVRDDGAGMSASGTGETGVGLWNTRERLRTLYGGAASLTVVPGATSGVTSTVRIPFRVPADA
jgi:two-component system, LytTR family, sensor kinase